MTAPVKNAVTPAREDTGTRIKRVLVRDLAECGLSRAQVAFDISQVVNRAITESQIDNYAAESKPHRIPIELIPAWVGVTRSHRLLDLLCEEVGLCAMSAQDRELAELGREQIHKERAERRLAEMKEKLWHAV
jgi:hypothetical protein